MDRRPGHRRNARGRSPLSGRGSAGASPDLAQAPLEAASPATRPASNPASRRRSRTAIAAGRAHHGAGAARRREPVRPDRSRSGRCAPFARSGPLRPPWPAAAAELLSRADRRDRRARQLSFSELDRRRSRAGRAPCTGSSASTAGDRVAVMCRNHRGFVQAAVAATRLGCDLVPLNTDFAGPQLGDVLAREGVSAPSTTRSSPVFGPSRRSRVPAIVAWHDERHDVPAVDELIAEGLGSDAPPPASHGRIVTLTSGTTGTPKGATRTLKARALAVPLALGGFLDLAKLKPTPRAGEPFVRRAAAVPSLRDGGDADGVLDRLARGHPPPFRPRGDARADRADARWRARSQCRRC